MRPIATISEQALAEVVDEWPPESQPFSRMWTAMAALDILTDGLSDDDLDDIHLLGGGMPDVLSQERGRYAWWAKHTSTADNPRAELEELARAEQKSSRLEV